MHSTIRSTARATPIVLTPPTGARAVADAWAFGLTRSKKKRLRDLLRAEPTAVHLAIAAAIYWTVPWVMAHLQGVRLQHDALTSVANYLLWSSTSGAGRVMAPMLQAAMLIHIAGAAVFTASALLPREPMLTPVHAAAKRLYRFVIVLPLWTIIASQLGRFIADEVYALGGIVTWDFTPLLARLETPFIEWLQRTATAPALSTIASNLFAAIWVAPLAFAGILLVVANKPKALSSLVIAFVLMWLCAVPFFALLPTFQPWTTNELYGARELATGIQYLSAHPSVSTLARINTLQHWSAGASLPSLHVAFPLIAALVLWQHGMRRASVLMAAAAAATMVAGVYLGRHWVADALLAIPFSYIVVVTTNRFRLKLVPGPRSDTRPTLRPNEIAVPRDPNVNTLQWLWGSFFVSGFAVVVYQAAWQSTFAGVILLFATIVLGLAGGSLIGGMIASRSDVRLPSLFAAAQIGIGVIGMPALTALRSPSAGTLESSPAGLIVTTFAASLLPTILIGAMLRLLVTDDLRVLGSAAGAARRYVANAIGAVVTTVAALMLLAPLGRDASLQFVAVLNVGMGVFIFVHSRRALLLRR